MNPLGYLDAPAMPRAAAPLELRAVAGGMAGASQLWQGVWWEGLHRGAVSATVVLLTLWLTVLTLAVLLRGRS